MEPATREGGEELGEDWEDSRKRSWERVAHLGVYRRIKVSTLERGSIGGRDSSFDVIEAIVIVELTCDLTIVSQAGGTWLGSSFR